MSKKVNLLVVCPHKIYGVAECVKHFERTAVALESLD
jgi:hypothetical protein